MNPRATGSHLESCDGERDASAVSMTSAWAIDAGDSARQVFMRLEFRTRERYSSGARPRAHRHLPKEALQWIDAVS